MNPLPDGEIIASAAGEQAQIKLLTLSNPSARNALSSAMYAAGIEAINHADSSPDIRAIIIVGAGEHFCAGGNVARLLHNRSQAPQVQAQSIDALHAFIEALATCRKPIIAAVEGAAAGAGFSLALACDLIVASRESFFLMAYSNIGLSPDGGASWQLTRQLPKQLAAQWMLTGERISATRLHQLGLVNQLSDPGQALNSALQLAEKLAERASNANASIKELIADAPHRDLHHHLLAERDHFVQNLHHPNAAIGIHAFLQKHPPKFL